MTVLASTSSCFCQALITIICPRIHHIPSAAHTHEGALTRLPNASCSLQLLLHPPRLSFTAGIWVCGKGGGFTFSHGLCVTSCFSESSHSPEHDLSLEHFSFSDSRLTLLLTVEQRGCQLVMEFYKDFKPCSTVSWPLVILRNKNLRIWGLWNVLECRIGVLCRSTVYIYLVQ